MSFFTELNAINVNEYTEKKNNLTYLSWSWAWAEVMKRYPSAT
ncbi:Sak single strand annealing protein, partial [Acinetobacter pittii]